MPSDKLTCTFYDRCLSILKKYSANDIAKHLQVSEAPKQLSHDVTHPEEEKSKSNASESESESDSKSDAEPDSTEYVPPKWLPKSAAKWHNKCGYFDFIG